MAFSHSTSSPLPKQCHNPRPQERRGHHECQSLVIPRPQRIEQKIPRQQLHEAGVDQDARAHRIQHPAHDVGSEGIGIVRRPHSQPDGDGDGSGQSVSGTKEPGEPGT